MAGKDQLSGRVIACAIEVHKQLGPGLLESAYEQCLAHEMALNGIAFVRQQGLPIVYRDMRLECGYRMDFLVEGRLLLEIKAIDAIAPIHQAQMLTYLKLSGLPIGLLFNFNVVQLTSGIKRFAGRAPYEAIVQ